MNKFLFSILALAMLVLPVSVYAAEFQAGDEYTLPAGDAVEDNLYTVGAIVNIYGDVNGDVNTAGSNISTSGTVRGDLSAAGGTVSVMGPVGDDLRVVGGQIMIGSTVGGEVLTAGGMITIMSEAVIEKDLHIVGAGKVTVNGTVKGNLVVNADELDINGKVLGSVVANATVINLASTASIAGVLDYTAPKQIDITPGVVKGKVNYTKAVYSGKGEAKDFNGEIKGLLTTLFTIALIAALITVILTVLLLPKTSKLVVDNAKKRFGQNLLIGLVATIVTPVVIILLFVSVFGFQLAILLIMLFALLMFIGKVFAGILFGYLVYGALTKPKTPMLNWWIAALGTFVLFLVAMIPIIGWLAGAVFFCAAAGSVLELFYKKLLLKR